MTTKVNRRHFILASIVMTVLLTSSSALMGLSNNSLQGPNRILTDGDNMIQTATATGSSDQNGGGDKVAV